MMESIIRLAHGMDMLVVSEGVEDTEQLSLVKAWGSDFVQGFLFAKPMPGDQIPDFFRKKMIYSYRFRGKPIWNIFR